jgi:RNA polymerase sigma factor (sigma-70 family)
VPLELSRSAEEEFREFVSAHLAGLRRLAYLACHDWHAAEDAVSAALPKLYANWAQIENPQRYAARAVLNAATDEVRRPWRRREEPVDQEILRNSADPVPDHGDLNAERLRVAAALRQVPPGQRTVLVLRFYKDFSVDEVAAILCRSSGTVKSQTARGLEALRRFLSAESAPNAA